MRSGRVARWLAHRPERFQAAFDTLASPFPCVLVGRGVVLRGQTERVRWEVRADRAWGIVDPFALLGKTLRFATLRGAGVEVRGLRIARLDGAPSAGLPPIADFPRPAGPPRPARVPWSWEFPELVVQDAREVWVEDLRLAGRLSGRGGFAFHRRREVEIRDSRLALEEARVAVAGTAAGALSGTLRFAVGRTPYHGAGAAQLGAHLDARADLRGTFEAARLGDHFLPAVPWIALSGPPAPFTARIRVEEGHLRPPTALRFTPAAQEVRVLDVALRGSGEIGLRVTRDAQGDRCDAGLRFTRFAARDDAGTVLLEGGDLRADLTTRDLRLAGPPRDLDLRFDLGHGELPDLARFASLLPATSALRLAGGRGTVRGHGAASSAPHSAEGDVEVRIDGADVAYATARLHGDLRLAAKLRDGDLTSRVFTLDGTEITAERFHSSAASGDERGWWAKVALPSARLELGEARRAQGAFTIALRDTGPLVALYDAKRGLPRWAERVLTVDGAAATGTFELSHGELVLPRFTSTRGDAAAVGSLRLARGAASARLLLTWKNLAAGVELRDGTRTLHLRDARAWFARDEPPAEASPRTPSP